VIKRLIVVIIPIAGSLTLFLSWVLQQSLLDHANRDYDDISAAQTTFHIYQSHNAVFNAVRVLGKNDEEVKEIRRLQINNYESGLKELQRLLNAKEQIGIPPVPDVYDETVDIYAQIATEQQRLELIQRKVIAKKEEIAKRKSIANKIFLAVYAIGSLTVLIGTVLSTTVVPAKASDAKAQATEAGETPEPTAANTGTDVAEHVQADDK
jgi:uncharacterized tellurite resistance protein B-like protein